MARRMFPDDRLAYSLTSGVIRGAVGRVATIYSDAAGTVLADILNEDGSANPTSTLTVDAYSRLPLFQGPVDGTDRLYGRIGTGPVVPLYARVDDRLDEEVAARAAGDAAERAYGTGTYALLDDQAETADNAVAIARIRELFSRPAGGLALTRTGNGYGLLHGIGGGGYTRWALVEQTGNLGGFPLRQLGGMSMVRAMLSVDENAAAVVFAGTWTRNVANASTTGGTYAHSVTDGSTATFTTPAGTTSIGIDLVLATNGARLATVSINGSLTAATSCFTAQQVVDFGWYPNTILTTNGGAIAPTTRVVEPYKSSGTLDPTIKQTLVDDIAAGAHTVVITATAAVRVGKTQTERFYLTGFLYGIATTRVDTAGAFVVTSGVLNALNSAWEFAHDVLPAGAATSHFLGNVHGYEVETGLTVSIDGAVVAPADGSTTVATRSIEITRTSELRHPETGTTNVATVVVVYRVDRLGLRVNIITTWNVAATVRAAYTMMPLNGATTNLGVAMNRANLLNWPGGAITLAGGGGDLTFGRSRSAAAWAWSLTGTYGALVYLPDALRTLNRWERSSPALGQVEDRNGSVTKVYLTRVSTGSAPETVAAGAVWTSSARYLGGLFPGGAEASLAAA